MLPLTQPEPGSIEEQAHALYAEKEYLQEHLGVADAASIVEMVKNLEAQLNDLYRDREDPTPL